jgi:hypothetical protein
MRGNDKRSVRLENHGREVRGAILARIAKRSGQFRVAVEVRDKLPDHYMPQLHHGRIQRRVGGGDNPSRYVIVEV